MLPQPDQDELDLIRRSGVVLRIGKLGLAAGTGSYRVKQSMAAIAGALGIERHEAQVNLTWISTTSHRGDSFRTEVTELRQIGINADRLGQLERLVQDVEGGRVEATVDAVEAELDRIEQRGLLYPALLNALWAALACACFAFLIGGGPVEVVGAAVGAGLGQAIRRWLLHRGLNQVGVTILAALVASLGYLALVGFVEAVPGSYGSHQLGYVAAVLFLVPGFPLVTAALDLARLDLSAGITRAVFAFMLLTAAALSLWLVSELVNVPPGVPSTGQLPTAALWTLRAVASFGGVLGFALLFNSTWPMALGAATIGMVANVGRLYLVHADVDRHSAALAASVAVGLMAAVAAPRARVPRITLSVPAVVVMVPGVAAYNAVWAFSSDQVGLALIFATDAALGILALSGGLVMGRMLTDPHWAFAR